MVNRESRLITTQLCVALANLALQLFSWKDAVAELVNALGSDPQTVPALLEFLKVLPEEFSSSRKLPITDQEYRMRTKDLLVDNAEKVLELLLSYINMQSIGPSQSLIFHCFNSWLQEIDTAKIINSPLLDLIFQALQGDSFESAIDCICSMIRETSDVDKSMSIIRELYPRVLAVRPHITQCRNDPEAYSGYTRLFAEAGESWYMLIAQTPKDFRGLAEAIAECTAFDEDLEVVKYTFHFWYILKTLLIMEKYNEARNELGDIYLTLVEVMISHLQYPAGTGTDLFNGDREEEDKFRDFRHEMGDVLKDCCSVVGASRALNKAFTKIVTQLELQARGQIVPWQTIEAPLFSMRAMARQVDTSESEMLPRIMKLLVQLPEHEKIRYAATLVLGRYTQWTAQHPEYLEPQLNYITSGFSHDSKSVISAAAQALKFFCQDCGHLLTNYIDHLYPFYEKVGSSLDLQSYYEVTNGIAHVVRAQPLDTMLQSLQYFGSPICQSLLEKARLPGEKTLYTSIADQVELLNIFVENLDVEVPVGTVRPISTFVIDVLPVISTLLDKHGTSTQVAERCSKFIRFSLSSCGTDLLQILPTIAELLALHFKRTHFGCYLWVTGTLVREFSSEGVDDSFKNAVWAFVIEQINTFFQYLTTIIPANSPDLVDDFFRLMGEVVVYYPFQLIASDLFVPSFEAAMLALNLHEYDPVMSSLQYLQDLFDYGSKYPQSELYQVIPDSVRNIILNLAAQKGNLLASKLILNQISSFPGGTIADAAELMLEIMQLVPAELAASWVESTLSQLPSGSVSEAEKTKLVTQVSRALNSGDFKQIKTLINDFTTWYSRRNLAHRD